MTSWLESANQPETDFPLENIPFGIFRADARGPRPGVAIGDSILDLSAVAGEGLLDDTHAAIVHECEASASLNPMLAGGREALSAIRTRAIGLLRGDTTEGTHVAKRRDALLVSRIDAELALPVRVGDYTDFYASIDHATTVGSFFRPDNPLLPNYKWVPIGYHGRASSIVPSGTAVRRPRGQLKDEGAEAPVFAPTKRLDYELEVGMVIAGENALGSSVDISAAESRIAGLCLVNDWSARDVQTWEYQPLGPFLAKNFATTMSPWLVTLDALAPFRAPAFKRQAGDPEPLPYLASPLNEREGALDITLEVSIASAAMRAGHVAPMRVSIGNFTSMYWTIAQLVTHHASNGCNLQPGDLLASGTVSGPDKESRGCLLERTWRGTEPLTLPTGELRRFLEDGDEIIMRAWCERAGHRRIGFGECRGIIHPAAA